MSPAKRGIGERTPGRQLGLALLAAALVHGGVGLFVQRTIAREFPRDERPEALPQEAWVEVDPNEPTPEAPSEIATTASPQEAREGASQASANGAREPLPAQGSDPNTAETPPSEPAVAAVTAPNGWFSPFAAGTPGSVRPSEAGGGVDLHAHYSDAPGATTGTQAAPSADRDDSRAAMNARAGKMLTDAVNAQEIERGTARGGEAVGAVSAIAHSSRAPGIGAARFSVHVGHDGISVALLDGGAETAAWRALLPELQAQVAAHPPPIPPGKRGITVVVATQANDQCPDGTAPRRDGSCPASRGPTVAGLGIGASLSLENLGQLPKRMVHTRMISSVVD